VSLSETEVPLEKVFREIKAQTGFEFVYNLKTLEGLGKVTVEVRNVSLAAALDACFRGLPLTYTITNKIVVIMERILKPGSSPPVGAAPAIDVHGKVTDSFGIPLAGASVTVKGTNRGTTTDAKGQFELKVVSSGVTIEVSFEGFTPRESTLKVGDTPVIRLMRNNNPLDEIQVIAYGTTTKRLNAGDVSTVNSAEIEMQPVSNPILALEGRVPGMDFVQVSGLPGSASAVQVRIRGINSISHPGDPLYIVDGVPYVSETLNSGDQGAIIGNSSGNPFNFLNPGDIESISVLKDADATAIYGSRGANGVVLITTKKGKEGNAKFEFNAQNGFGNVAHRMKLLNLRQYLDMRYEAFRNDGATPDPNVDYDLTLWDTTRATDWQKKLIGGTAQFGDLQGSLSGGNTGTQYLLGGGYHNETTVFPGDWHDGKGSIHFNLTNTAFKGKLRLLVSANYSTDDNHLGEIDFTQASMLLPPDAPNLLNADGSINWAPNKQGYTTWPNGLNPIAATAMQYDVKTNNLIGKALISYQVLDGLELKTSLGYTNMTNNGFSAIPFAALAPSDWPSQQRTSRFADNHITTWIVEPQLSYNTSFLGGVVTALAGSTIERNLSIGQAWNAAGFSTDLLMSDILAATNITAGRDSYAFYKYNATFGRGNYNLKSKYVFDVVARRDGSSRFGPDNRYANFYSVAGAWIFSNEKFLQKWFPSMSFGKIRFSYGTTGNDQIGDYTYLDLYNNLIDIAVPYQGASGIRPATIYTPSLQWELTKKLEAGLETGFFKDRILFSISGYLNRSSNQLLLSPLPTITGFFSVEQNIPAVLQNKGVEVELSTVNIKDKAFRWSTSLNFTRNINVATLIHITKNMGRYYQQFLGKSIGLPMLVYRFAGVDPITGVYLFKNSQGKPVDAPNPATDEVYMNLSPKFYGGMQNSLSYQGLQLDFIFQFVSHVNQGYPFFSVPGVRRNQPVNVLNRWQKPGDVSNFEKFSENVSLLPSSTYAQQSTLYYGDASFIRLKNLSISYSLPSNSLKRLGLQNLRFFVHGQNLLTITNYNGIDPESLGANSLPPLRVVTFGLLLTIQ